MRFLKRSEKREPRVSLVLLDWSVRESFHLLHYLSKQTIPSEEIEVIVVEFYARVSEAVMRFERQVDTWVALEIPESCYYHKHLMYNAGIALARGGIVVICDSDAMVRETFIETIVRHFDSDPKIALHLDQFRNGRRELYPFDYPSFAEVTGDGCINEAGGVTTGVLDESDPIHTRNYGACMCAQRRDLIEIGGADMHLDYLGHICGPYEMTWRLANLGRREVWDTTEFTYHTWHPGQAGAENYLGPHDGRHVSTTALEALRSGRVKPLLENRAMERLRTGTALGGDEVIGDLVDQQLLAEWNTATLSQRSVHSRWTEYRRTVSAHGGFRIDVDVCSAHASLIRPQLDSGAPDTPADPLFRGLDFEDTVRRIDAVTPRRARLAGRIARVCDLAGWGVAFWRSRSQRVPATLPAPVKLALGAALAPLAVLAAALWMPRRVARKLTGVARRESPLQNLVLAVHNLSGFGALARFGGKVLVLVDSRRASLCLRALEFVRLLPRLEVRRTPDSAATARVVADPRTLAAALIVPEQSWPRMRDSLADARSARRIFVV